MEGRVILSRMSIVIFPREAMTREETPDDETFQAMMYGFAKANPAMIGIFILTVAVIPMQEVLMPHLYGSIISSIEKRKPFFRSLAIVLGLLLLTQIVVMVSEWQETSIYPRLQEFVRNRLLDRLMAAQSRDYYELETGRIVSVLSKLPTAITQYIDVTRNNIVPHLLIYVLVGAYVVTVDPVLSLGLFLTGLSSWFLAVWGPRICAETSSRRDRAFNRVNEGVDDLLRNLMSVLNLDQTQQERDRLSHLMERYKEYSVKSLTCYSGPRLFVVLVHLGFVAAYVWRAYRLYKDRRLPSALFVTLMLLVLNVIDAFRTMMSDIRDQTFRWGIIEESLRTFNELTAPRSYPGLLGAVERGSEEPERRKKTVLRLKHVYFRYPTAISNTLQDINLEIRSGERVALVGTIGCGKSTIGKLIMRYHRPAAGEIYLHDVPYSDMTTREIRSRVAMVPQQPILFNRTVLENICYGMLRPDEERVWELIHELGLGPMFESFPEGLHSRVGKGGSRLSGGQRQIVWILRCLLQEPMLLILDEPTSALDPKTKNTAMRLFERISKGRTLLFITHDEDMMRFASRVITMQSGQIVKSVQAV